MRRRAHGTSCVFFLSDSYNRNGADVHEADFTLVVALVGSITSRCSGKEPALRPERTAGLVDLSIVNFDQ